MSFGKFLKNQGVIAALFMAIFYQIIFMVIYLPGYSAVPKNIDELHVAIVNDDDNYGKALAKQLKESLPFKEIDTDQTLKESKDLLEERKISMVIHIPSDFSANLQSSENKQPNIDYYVNGSNPTMITSTLTSITNQIDTKISGQFSLNKAKGILMNLNVPEKQADQLAASIQNSFDSKTVTINKMPDGMHNQMAPMFLTLVSYVGAMIASLTLSGVYRGVKNVIGKWRAFFYHQAVAVLIAVVAPLIGISILYLIHGYGGGTFIQLWLHHALELLVALEFTSVFCLLFGQLGMIINLPIMLIQVIANGAVLPREMMYLPYKIASYISPMYYSVQSDYSLLFGGGRLANYEWHLVLIGAVVLTLNVLVVAVVHRKSKEVSIEKVPSES
ncbi:hypothetical protein GCM10011391_07460 [Pullulanibacillus camelliae]|uniref:ABC-2 type transporter transmembrane domain-containing protein n=1 Tax=Pullulanibacillus camelliae TaxID=1707096 RepID=A0A8J2YCP5_9BACL|nr:ABC transporter permease [Pullulanibacillus camelliae]GGE31296.1 hypothetical protein GCM10011391_07460 [Pullulanibacillus camelliae]